MDMVFHDNKLFVVLEGDVDIKKVVNRLDLINREYYINSIIIDKKDMFNYSNRDNTMLKRMFSNVVIKK